MLRLESVTNIPGNSMNMFTHFSNRFRQLTLTICVVWLLMFAPFAAADSPRPRGAD